MSDITYSAVEAAAKSQFGIDAARLGIDHARLGQAWDDAKRAVQHAYRESVLAAVTGAAPVIEAQVRAQIVAQIEAAAQYEGVLAQRVIAMCAYIARDDS